MKLNAIMKQAETRRRKQAREHRAEDIRHLSPRFHVPSAGPDGTVRCSCTAAPFSPQAYQRHVAGEPARDMQRGVYTAGLNDSWALEQERGQSPSGEPVERQHETGERYRDEDGNEWLGILDEFKRRAWRCIAGHRMGDVELDVRLYVVLPEKQTAGVGGYAADEF